MLEENNNSKIGYYYSPYIFVQKIIEFLGAEGWRLFSIRIVNLYGLK